MSSFITCPDCKRKLKLPTTAARRSFRCPACKAIIPPSSISLSCPPQEDDSEQIIEVESEKPIGERPLREEGPKSKKSSPTLVIALVAGGVVLLLLMLGTVGGVLWYLSRNRAIPESEWQPFSPPNGGCTVLMPGVPVPKTMKVGDISVTHYHVVRKKENLAFELGFFNLAAPNLPSNIMDTLVKGGRDRALAMTNGKAKNETSISLGRLPGREYQVELAKGERYIARLYLAKVGKTHRVYQVAIGGSKTQSNMGDAARFFDSFKIDDSAMPPTIDSTAKEAGLQSRAEIKPAQPNRKPKPPPAVAGPVQPAKPAPPPTTAPRPSHTLKAEELTKLLSDLRSADEATRRRAVAAAKLSGLLAYWSFDEGEGTRAKDASDNGMHAKLVNASWTDGVRGKALRLSGKDSYLDYGDSPRLSFAARAPFTIAFWTRTTRTKGTLLSQRNSRDGGAVIDMLIADGKVKIQVRQDGNDFFAPTEVASGTINDGNWHHLALTRDGDRIELFLNGVSQGQKRGNSSGGAITTDLRALGAERYWINRRTFAFGDPYFEGDMDEFCIFDHMLKASEIAALAIR